MKPATISQLKQELKNRSSDELLKLCLDLTKYKKENKELLSYLLFEESDEQTYIKDLKTEIDEDFKLINRKTPYLAKKSVRKILRNIKKHIRYSRKKETEVELMMYFCSKLKQTFPNFRKNTVLLNIYDRQLVAVKKTIASLHEDLQYDYENV
ncbi:MAG: hypothetical protein PHH30_12155, partial [Bacteroidales bacterium]|nr:hypothetical protein [Bacteroidales bacterium]